MGDAIALAQPCPQSFTQPANHWVHRLNRSAESLWQEGLGNLSYSFPNLDGLVYDEEGLTHEVFCALLLASLLTQVGTLALPLYAKTIRISIRVAF